MNWVDLIITLVTLAFVLEGINTGFLDQTINIGGFFLALVLSLVMYLPFGVFLTRMFKLSPLIANPVAFLVIWLLAEVVFFTAINSFASQFFVKFQENRVNKLLGFIPAIINASIFLAFVLLLFVSFPFRPDVKNDIFKSKIGSALVEKATTLERPLDKIFGPITKQSLTFLTVDPKETTSVDLHFKTDSITIDNESEKQMFNLVNQERQKAGVAPLSWDESLAQVARSHSEDMFKRGYFSHYSPEGKDVGDRLQEAGIEYTYAGENLALAPNVKTAHEGLMNSEGHRRNILDPSFSKIGIGAVNGGIYGEMFTQVFTN